MPLHEFQKVFVVAGDNRSYDPSLHGHYFNDGAEKYLLDKGLKKGFVKEILTLRCPRNTPELIEVFERFGVRPDLDGIVDDCFVAYLCPGYFKVSTRYENSPYDDNGDEVVRSTVSNEMGDRLNEKLAVTPVPDDRYPYSILSATMSGFRPEVLVREAGVTDFERFATPCEELKKSVVEALLLSRDEPESQLEFDYVNLAGESKTASVCLPSPPLRTVRVSVESQPDDGTRFISVVLRGRLNGEPVKKTVYDRWVEVVNRVFDAVLIWRQ